MPKKVVIELTVKVVAEFTDDLNDVDEFVSELDYDFQDGTGNAIVEDTEIRGYEIM